MEEDHASVPVAAPAPVAQEPMETVAADASVTASHSPNGSVHGEAMDAMLAAVAHEEASRESEPSEHEDGEDGENGEEGEDGEEKNVKEETDDAALASASTAPVPAAPVMPFLPVPTVAMTSVQQQQQQQPPHHFLSLPMKHEAMPTPTPSAGGVPFSRLTNEPPRLVFHSTRTSDNSLESTRRLLLRVQLSDAAVNFLNCDFNHRWTEFKAMSELAEPPNNVYNPNATRMRLLSEALRDLITVDILYFDFTLPCSFAQADPESENSTDGEMTLISAPTMDLELDYSCVGMVNIRILPRTLPVSSTHQGRPFRLLITINEREHIASPAFYVMAKQTAQVIPKSGFSFRARSVGTRRGRATPASAAEQAQIQARQEKLIAAVCSIVPGAVGHSFFEDANRRLCNRVVRTFNRNKAAMSGDAAAVAEVGRPTPVAAVPVAATKSVTGTAPPKANSVPPTATQVEEGESAWAFARSVHAHALAPGLPFHTTSPAGVAVQTQAASADASSAAHAAPDAHASGAKPGAAAQSVTRTAPPGSLAAALTTKLDAAHMAPASSTSAFVSGTKRAAEVSAADAAAAAASSSTKKTRATTRAAVGAPATPAQTSPADAVALLSSLQGGMAACGPQSMFMSPMFAAGMGGMPGFRPMDMDGDMALQYQAYTSGAGAGAPMVTVGDFRGGSASGSAGASNANAASSRLTGAGSSAPAAPGQYMSSYYMNPAMMGMPYMSGMPSAMNMMPFMMMGSYPSAPGSMMPGAGWGSMMPMSAESLPPMSGMEMPGSSGSASGTRASGAPSSST